MPLPPKVVLHDAVASRIMELSDKKQYSRGELAMAAQVPKSTITDYLRGASTDMKLETVAKIANGLGLTMRDFFDDDRFDLIDIEDLLY